MFKYVPTSCQFHINFYVIPKPAYERGYWPILVVRKDLCNEPCVSRDFTRGGGGGGGRGSCVNKEIKS